ncbi:hypothetical protein ACWA7J_14550 [Leptothrix sp. BB-4]
MRRRTLLGLVLPALSPTVTRAGATGQTGFTARPYLFKPDEARLRASRAARDPEAIGATSNDRGRPIGFLSLAAEALVRRRDLDDLPTWHLAVAGWIDERPALVDLALREALQIVLDAPGGDRGRSDRFQHVEARMFDVAATIDLALAVSPERVSPAQLRLAAAWVNGTLENWNRENRAYWPLDNPLNNYWHNGFLAHAVAGLASEGWNPQASTWRARFVEMARRYAEATTPPRWHGPVQSEGHYYGAYVSHALWAMALHDAVLGTRLIDEAQVSWTEQIKLVLYQLRPHLQQFFLVGSEASDSTAPHTPVTWSHALQLVHAARGTPEAALARQVLLRVDAEQTLPRAERAWSGYYWNLQRGHEGVSPAQLPSLFVAPTPGAGLIGLRSKAGFEPRDDARAALVFANRFDSSPAWSHANPDAPGFQWAVGSDWLVTDPEQAGRSGILGEAGGRAQSDISNIVTLDGQRSSERGGHPRILRAEALDAAAGACHVVQVDAQPYWTAASVYRRDYVWLDDLRSVLVFDRISSPMARTWRLHLPVEPVIGGSTATCRIGRRSLQVHDLMPVEGQPWQAVNLAGQLTEREVWRLSRTEPRAGLRPDYRALVLCSLDGHARPAGLQSVDGTHEVRLMLGAKEIVVRLHDDGRRPVIAAAAAR